VARKTAADVHLELSVHQKESAERWKTAFNKFVDIELELKELQQKVSGGLTTLIVLLVGLICSVVALLIEDIIL
jgi:predicted metalloenzyme YecM